MFYLAPFVIIMVFFGSSGSIYKKAEAKTDLLSSFCNTDVQAYAGTTGRDDEISTNDINIFLFVNS